MEYTKPLGVRFSNKSNSNPNWVDISPVDPWDKNISKLKEAFSGREYDWVALQFDHKNLHETRNTFKSMNLLTNQIAKLANEHGAPLVDITLDEAYVLNVGYKGNGKNVPVFDINAGDGYVASDHDVLEKKSQFDAVSETAWEKHQSIVWDKMSVTMPLGNGQYGVEDHRGLLLDPSRGLTDADIKDMWSWKSKTNLSPGLYNDDFLGMSGILAKQFNGYTFKAGEHVIAEDPINLSTMGADGYVIPMRNPNGDMAKFQVGTDVKGFNCVIKAKSEDGISIQKSEIYDKVSKTYNFMKDGAPSNLRIKSANNKEVVMEDSAGEFTSPLKKEIKDVLVARGYDIPDIIGSLKPMSGAKYMWPAKGNMVGSEDVSKIVAPSNAGFIVAKEPKHEKGNYNVLVVEGALKGRITAKYLGHENCQELASEISGDNGIIVAQVPGVAKAFVESVGRIYSDYPIEKTIIAMDADGRTNLNVAKGIHQSFNELAQYTDGNIEVMSWDPEQKGIDDALLAMSRKEISIDHMDLKFGSAKELFPLSQASMPIPLRLDGTLAFRNDNRPEWQVEYTESRINREKEHRLQQIATELRNGARDLDSFLRDLSGAVDENILLSAGKPTELTDDDLKDLDNSKGVSLAN